MPDPTSSIDAPALIALVPTASASAVRDAGAATGYSVQVVETLQAFFKALSAEAGAVALISLSADQVDERIAGKISNLEPRPTLLLSTDRVDMERALFMERVGAVALLHEPLDAAEMVERLHQVADEGEVLPLPEPGDTGGDAPTLIGSSPSMAGVFQALARVAPTPSTVILRGESGTGKEVAARMLHWASPRRERPFVAVNCAAIPEHLLESELFGHEKGAFTGAAGRRIGRFERAHTGTLFLDEIGDMSLVLQAKILRILEDRRLERVGGEESVEVDVRIVTATHRNLRDRIREGEFREDLYYRLSVVEIEMPPLRERGRDLEELALFFAAHFARRYDRELKGVSEAALRRLEAHGWPGNVRELRNVMDRAVLLAQGDTLRSADLRLGAGTPRASGHGPAAADLFPPTLTLQEVEAAYIRKVLVANGGHMGRTADTLGIHRNTLTRKVQEYGLDAPGEGGKAS
jgi:DNA-binding NtrC family response regulator